MKSIKSQLNPTTHSSFKKINFLRFSLTRKRALYFEVTVLVKET